MGVLALLTRRARAFTLIELMIVVAIFAVLSAILIPNLIRAKERARMSKEGVDSVQAMPRPEGLPPLLESAVLVLDLHVQPLRVGLDIANRYQLETQGEFRLSAGGSGTHLVLFELPEGVDQVEGLVVQVRSQDGNWQDPENLVYARDFLAWQVPAEEFPIEVRLAYGASGTDRLVQRWPHASKIKNLQVTLTTGQQAALTLPLGSLRPTHQVEGRYDWELENVLSPAPIAIELSALDSPLAQAGQLFRLTGLAVLLFGAGFWYLAELYRVGSLRDFGFGSFLLLALTYSSFFVSVAVLSLDGRLSTPVYLLVSLGLCLPLLVFHVSQLVDSRFALTRAFPLALLTLCLVLLGVYGGGWRALGFLILGMLILGFMTATYRPFRQTQEQRIQYEEELLSQARRVWEELNGRGRSLESTLLSQLKNDQILGDGHASRLRDRVAALGQVLDQSPSTTYEGLNWGIEQLQRVVHLAQESLSQVEAVETESQMAKVSTAKQGRHCSFCGAPGMTGRYCGDCGSHLPENRVCAGCSLEVPVPVSLLPTGQAFHCHGCGHRV